MGFDHSFRKKQETYQENLPEFQGDKPITEAKRISTKRSTMRLTKIIFFLVMILSLNAFANDDGKISPPCATKEACLNDPNCLCWCSQICNWRKKTPDDHPVYIENDPYGKFCYCKQWDFDHYKDNCLDKKDVMQPKGAQ